MEPIKLVAIDHQIVTFSLSFDHCGIAAFHKLKCTYAVNQTLRMKLQMRNLCWLLKLLQKLSAVNILEYCDCDNWWGFLSLL